MTQTADNRCSSQSGRTSRGWLWVPTLYFAEAIPNVAVVTLAVIMYKNFGLPNSQIAMLTGWLYLPWVIKPFWSPFVDILRSKRWWILAMQWTIGIALSLVALALPLPCYLTLTLVFLWLMSFASATHDIAADGFYMLALDTHGQSLFVGIRSLFYRLASVACQGGLVVMAGMIQDGGGTVITAWMAVFGLLALFFFGISVYHSFILPRPADDRLQRADKSAGVILKEFAASFRTFFAKPGIVTAILFMLLYRLPEAQLVKLISPFLLDAPDAGGLGLSTSAVGLVYGTVGVTGLITGGIIGGIAAAVGGLRRWMMPMAISMSLTCLTFVYLAYATEHPMWVINACVFVEQFGYGFGFTAYMLYLIYFSSGEYKTSHYAICTAFMALSIMVPGIWAGYLQEMLGYRMFFIWTMVCCAATILIAAFVKVDPDFGKKK